MNDLNMYGFFISRYEKHKAKTAFIFYGRKISFKQTVQMIEVYADKLAALKVKKGDVITLHLPNVPQAVFLFYALNKMGAIANILHPLMSPNQIAEQMKACNSGFLITTDHFLSTNSVSGIEKILYCTLSKFMGVVGRFLKQPKLGGFLNIDRFVPEKEAVAENSFTNCACYLNSGGTTGKSKIIKLSNQAINNLVSKKDSILPNIDLKDRVAYCVLPIFHGFGLCMNMHLGLCYGAAQLLVLKFNAAQGIRLVKRFKVGFINGVPQMFKKLLDSPKFNKKSFSSLTRCFVGGDNVSKQLLTDFEKKVGSEILYEGYGLTETVTVCTLNTVGNAKSGSVGKALPAVKIAVRTENGTVQTVGQGEVLVAGDTAMLGYLGERELLPDEWIPTGDLGVIDGDGFLFIKDRIKDIIKINGITIFPKDLENTVLQLPFVKAVRVLSTDENEKVNIFAVVVLKEKSLQTEQTKNLILSHIEKNTIKYALPKQIFFSEKIPLTLIGKVDSEKIREWIREEKLKT